jgi:hypothetical protein
MVIAVAAGAFLAAADADTSLFYVFAIALSVPVVIQGLYRGEGLPSFLQRGRRGPTVGAAAPPFASAFLLLSG